MRGLLDALQSWPCKGGGEREGGLEWREEPCQREGALALALALAVAEAEALLRRVCAARAGAVAAAAWGEMERLRRSLPM